MGFELPKSEHHYDGEPPWKKDRAIRKDRRILVPDTLEWSGKRPPSDEWRFRPIDFIDPSGFDLHLPCRDMPKGRLITTSTCAGLGTPIMPFGDHAWAYLEIAESAADEFLRRGWQVSRVDFARDLRVPCSRVYLLELVRRAASLEIPGRAYFEEDTLGVTFKGVAGGDRLRIYHKGLETKHKFRTGWKMDQWLEDVIRVELQLRRGQLDEKVRKDVRALRTARVEPAPTEDDVPVARVRPSRGHGIRKRHLWAMRRDRHPQRALEATEAVDKFLLELELDWLMPDAFGVELPDPRYGWTPQNRTKR